MRVYIIGNDGITLCREAPTADRSSICGYAPLTSEQICKKAGSHVTHRWREVDSNSRFRARLITVLSLRPFSFLPRTC